MPDRLPPTRTVEARNAIVLANQGLVCAVARRWSWSKVPRADLIGSGQLGLIRAADIFDPAKGVLFATFAYRHIWRAIQLEVWLVGFVVSLPHEVADAARAGGDAPGARQAHKIMGGRWVPFDEVLVAVDDSQAAIDRDEAAAALSGLPTEQSTVLRLRFGLDGEGERTRQGIGTILNVTPEDVRKHEARAFASLRVWAARRADTRCLEAASR